MEQVSDEQYNAAPSDVGRTRTRASAADRRRIQPQSPSPQPGADRPSGPLQQKVAPGMAALTDDVLYGDVWKRPDLSPRDRSLVTITALIAMGKTAPLAGHLGRALDNGLQPSEASGLLAHLAVYCGWPSAVAALEAYDQVYTARKVDTAALRAVESRAFRLPPRMRHEPKRSPMTSAPSRRSSCSSPTTWCSTISGVGPISVVRDRSLVTIAALAAIGDDDQLDAYVRRGLESGLTRIRSPRR